MANLGENLLGHPLEVRIKGDEPGTVTATLLAVGLGGVVVDTHDEGQPWHIADRDIARWRLACHCDLLRALPFGCATAPEVDHDAAVRAAMAVA